MVRRRHVSHGSYGSYGGVTHSSYGSTYVASRPVVHRSYAVYRSPSVIHSDSGSACCDSCGETIVGVSHEQTCENCAASTAVYESAPVESYESYTVPSVEESYTVPSVDESYEAPAIEPEPAVTPQSDAEAELQQDSALFAVTVPEDAVVYVNDYRTQTTGTHREYMSAGLREGRDYTYTVRAVVQRDSQELTQTKYVTVRGGEAGELAFVFDDGVPSTTTLTINVPEKAKVQLAGNDTSVKGTQRVYATQQLSAGQTWSNYRVLVSLDRNGETLTQERTLEVRAGENHELSFDFDDDIRLAAN